MTDNNNALKDFNICQTSNISVENLDDESLSFHQEASARAESRRSGGFDINGKPGGIFNEKNPPAGRMFGGFLKGNIGIIWKDIAIVMKNNEGKSSKDTKIHTEDIS